VFVLYRSDAGHLTMNPYTKSIKQVFLSSS
jgi:hypothetical protein